MSEGEETALPLGLAIWSMARERAPHLEWEVRRVLWAVQDYQDVIDVAEVARRCLMWLSGPEARRVKDGPAQLARYFEQEKERRAPNVSSLAARLRVYGTPDVVVAPSTRSSSASRPHRAPA